MSRFAAPTQNNNGSGATTLLPRDGTVNPYDFPEQDPEGPGHSIDPLTFLTPHALAEARKSSWLRLQWVRDMRERVIRAYAGVMAEDQTQDPVIVNLVEQAVDTLHPQLTYDDPHCNVEPVGSSSLSGAAMIRKLSSERTARDIGLGDIHSQAVLDALLGPMAICRTGLRAGPERYNVRGREFRQGIFYAALIDFDDYVIDQGARNDSECIFEGHRYRIPRSIALDSDLYDNSVIENLPVLKLGKMEQGQVEGLEGWMGDPYRLVEMIELWDIAVYLGDCTLICTLTDVITDKWCRKPYEYWGPDTGPYVKLSFSRIPNVAIPKIFGARIMPISDAINQATDKVVDDIVTEKTTYAYAAGEEDFADAMRLARNNEWIKTDNPEKVKTMTSGGIKQETIGAISFLRDCFNSASMSPDILGGTKDQSGTATGASILQGNAVVRLKRMQRQSQTFLTKIFRHIAWYKDSDSQLQETVVARLPGDISVELQNTAQLREGAFADFNYEVDAYATQPMDPVMRLAKFLELLPQIPVLAQLGPDPFGKIMHVAAQALEMPELDDISPDAAFMQIKDQLAGMVPQAPQGQPVQPAQGPKPVSRMAAKPVNQVRSANYASVPGQR